MSSMHKLRPDDIAQIKALLLSGCYQHVIAAKYGLNQGRISEINTGKLYKGILPAKGANDAH